MTGRGTALNDCQKEGRCPTCRSRSPCARWARANVGDSAITFRSCSISFATPSAGLAPEVGPRDGLQNEDPVPTEAKVELIDALSKTGVGRIEAVSFVHPRAIPQMADADEVWAGATRSPDVRYSALVPNSRATSKSAARRPAMPVCSFW